MLFAYFGPETVLPLTSVFAALAGVVLMFGRQVRLVARVVFRRVSQVVRRDKKANSAPVARAGKRIDRPSRTSPHPGAVATNSETLAERES